jgi:hypothetical protein
MDRIPLFKSLLAFAVRRVHPVTAIVNGAIAVRVSKVLNTILFTLRLHQVITKYKFINLQYDMKGW